MSYKYKDWIYCPTCDMKILIGSDTEDHYGVINHMAKPNKTIDVPVAWGHIFNRCSSDRILNHVKTVSQDSKGIITYLQDKHQIDKIQKHLFSIGSKKIFWPL